MKRAVTATQVLKALTQETDHPEWGPRAAARLRQLADALERQLMEFKQSGAWEELPLRAPQFLRAMERLDRKQQGALQELRALAAELAELNGPPSTDVMRRLKETLHSVERYEQEEDLILQRAYWDDIGVGD
ncbi:MAG: hypothetical protein D6729_02530 [Deltaproteobacteria bacterium]|nr:MAG: hypothetical protein D6729_02530 [Deltaproteobacteria bacterium]